MSFFDKIGEALACVSAPVDCAVVGSLSWLDAQSAIWVLAFGLVAGMCLGAWLGWKGLAVLATGGALVFFLNRGKVASDGLEVADEDPPHIKRLKQSQERKPAPVDSKSAFQKWIRGE